MSNLLDKLISYYPLDANGNDVHSTNNGTPSGSVSYIPAKINNGAQFNTGKLDMGDQPELNPDTGNFTISFWLKYGGSEAVNQHFVTKATDLIRGYFVYIYNHTLYFSCGSGALIQFSEYYVDNNLHFVLCEWNQVSKKISILVDNFHYKELSYGSTDGQNPATAFLIGETVFNYRCESLLDEVAIFGDSLTTLEKDAMWNNGNGLPYPLVIPPIPDPRYIPNNLIFLYDYMRKIKAGSWVSPDDSNEYYIGTTLLSEAGNVSALNNEFTLFYRDNDYTKYIDWDNGDDTTGDGTFELPYKSLKKALETMEYGVFDGICILTQSENEDDLGGRTLDWNDAVFIRIFAIGKNTPIININNSETGADKWFFEVTNPVQTSPNCNIAFFNVCFNFNSDENNDGYLYKNSSTNLVTIGFYFCSIYNCGSKNQGIDYNGIDKNTKINYLEDILQGSITVVNSWNSIMYRCSYGTDSSLKFVVSTILYECVNLFFTKALTLSVFSNNIVYQCSELFIDVGGTFTIYRNILVNTVFNPVTNIGIEFCCSNLILFERATVPVRENNIKSNPLFVNSSPIRPEDFMLQTKEINFKFDSPCYLTGNLVGDKNMGAFQGLFVDLISYRKYELKENPQDFLPTKSHLQFNSETDINIKTFPFSLGVKLNIQLIYRNNSYVVKADAGALEYISTHLVFLKQDPFGKTIDEITIRIFEDIDGLDSGNISNIDSVNKIITVDREYTHDEYFGYQFWAVVLSILDINVTGKVLTGFTGLTTDQYKGYSIFINDMVYSVESNTTNSITVNDYYDNLVDGLYDVYIFRILLKFIKQIENKVYVKDLFAELTNEFISYVIQDIKAVVMTPEMSYSILGYNRKLDLPKNARTFNFIQV